MAYTPDVFAGSYVSVFYSDDVKNVALDSDKFKEIPEISVFPQSGIERSVIAVPNFTSKYGRKLVGRGSVPSIDMSVNYIPESIHDALFELCENGQRGQFKIVYWIDATKDVGMAVVYNGFLAKASFSGGEEAVVAQEMTLEVDGGPVVKGVIDNTKPETLKSK